MWTFRALVIALLTLLIAAPAASAQSSGLVAAYGFEESSGISAVDSSGAGNAGSLTGAARSASGRFGAALSFDGIDDRVDVADSASLDLATGMTLEAWVRPESAGWRTVIMKERLGGLAYLLYASTDTNRPSTEVHTGSTSEARGAATLPGGVWTHLASTYDGAVLRLYVNGTQVASRAATGLLTATSNPLRIGGNTVWGEYFRGLIDEVRVYNRALTAGEIQIDMGTAIVAGDAQAPTAPVLNATLAGNDVHLTWSGATDNVGVTGYRILRDGTLVTTLAAGAGSYDDLDRPGGTYRYTVRALDAAGHLSPASNEAVVTVVPDTTPPTAPVLSAAVEGDGVHLSWTESTDDGEGVGSYEVYRLGALFGDRSTRLAGLGADARAYVDHTDLPSETTYRYRVLVRDRAGNFVNSNSVDVRIGEEDLAPPTAPVLTVSGGVLRWTAATDDHAIMEYAVYVDGRVVQFHGPQTLEDGFLRPAPGSRITIRATDTAFKLSQFSNEVVVAYSLGLTATKPDGNDVTLVWTAPTDGAVASSYRVYRDGSLIHTRGGASPREFSESNLTPGTYRYKVQATDGSNRIWESNLVDVVITEDTSPPTASLAMACGATVHDYVEVRGTTSDDRGPITWHAEVDGAPIMQPSTTLSSGGPFRFEWETRNFANGPHDLTLVLRDGAGNQTTTDPCRFTVHNPVVTVPFAGLSDGDTVSGVVNVTAVPHGDGEPLPAGWPIVGVYFGGAISVFDSTGPYGTTWDTTKVANGVYTLTAAVQWMDYSLPRATNSIQVRVANMPPPVVDITSHAGGDVIDGTVTFTADVLQDGAPLERDGLAVRWDITPAGGGTGTSGTDGTRPFQHTFDTGTTPDGLYDVKATATWAGGGPVTKTIQVRVRNAPPAPTGLRAQVRQDDIDLLWDVSPGATSYNVYRDGTRIGTTTGTAVTDADRPPGTYRYTVRGQRFDAEGEPSAEVTATVAGATPAGLVAAYGFEHSAGTTAADSSGTGSTGTISGATSVAGGRFGRALSFDGTNDMVTVADANALDLAPGMTLSAWVRPTTVNDWRTVLLKERPGSLAYALYAATDSGRPMTEISASGMREARGSAALPVNSWSHLAATYDRTTLRLYVNGTQVASALATATLTNSAGALRIGGNSVWGEWFSGLIDEVRVYERALSAAEILADRDRPVVAGT